VVLEPEFRGSDGFGDRHMRAGFKQWGLAMQDDVADTATWAAARHLIDPKRVCLAGSGYGGYAALMGLIRHPQQFRCGISWGAPTDLDALYDIGWDDWLDIVKRHGLPALLGDRQRDAEQLRATSPLRLAAQLRQPLLLAHGGQDRRVPIAHGERLRDALKDANPKVEWVEYRTEGEGWFLLDNDVDFWTRAERFLAEQLQPGHALINRATARRDASFAASSHRRHCIRIARLGVWNPRGPFFRAGRCKNRRSRPTEPSQA